MNISHRAVKSFYCLRDFRTPKVSHVEDLAAVEDSADLFLAKTIRSMEEKMNDAAILEDLVDDDHVVNAEDNVGSGNVYVSPVLFINSDEYFLQMFI